MDQLRNTLTTRVVEARAALAAAQAAGDDYLVVVRQGELESLALLAAEHDIALPDDPATSPVTPPGDRVISLVDLERRRIA